MNLPSPWRLPRQLHAALLLQARASAPDECCGALLSHPAQGVQLLALRNAAPDASRAFAVDSAERLALWRLCQRSGAQLLGWYHSHPACAALPSARDIAYAEAGLRHLIVSPQAHWLRQVRGFHLQDGRALEFPLEFIDE